MTIQEKRNLGASLGRLSHEELAKALEILAQNNPSIQAKSLEINLDLDAQNETTLWRLGIFVKYALEARGRSSSIEGGKITDPTRAHTNTETNANINTTNNSKRKKEICDSFTMTAKKKSK